MADVPSTGAALWTLFRLTLTRIGRGRLLWVSVAISILPILAAIPMSLGHHFDKLGAIRNVELFVLAILPPLFGAPAIAEELEDRTATYLWSRPLARSTILAGRLLALAPCAALVVVASWWLAARVATNEPPPAASIGAFAAGALGVAVLSAGIATLAPKRGMGLAVVYVLLVDLPIGQLPVSLRWLSVTHATGALGGFESDSAASGAIALAVIAAVWLAVAFRRVGRLEA
ncbi:MAG: hypothetical protein ABI678_26550 [Kofleriaceae bacterium]